MTTIPSPNKNKMKTTYPNEAAPDCNYWFNYIYSLLNHPNATRYIQDRNADKSNGKEVIVGEIEESIRTSQQNTATKKAVNRTRN